MRHSFNAKANEYANLVPDAPARVLAAIAFSWAQSAAFAFPEGDDGNETIDPDVAIRRMAHEWQILHANGIVPQPLPKSWQRYL